MDLGPRHYVVLSWLTRHPGATPEDMARGFRAPEDADEIARVCAGLEAAGLIERAWPRRAKAN